jgi:hypothetical protein
MLRYARSIVFNLSLLSHIVMIQCHIGSIERNMSAALPSVPPRELQWSPERTSGVVALYCKFEGVYFAASLSLDHLFESAGKDAPVAFEASPGDSTIQKITTAAAWVSYVAGQRCKGSTRNLKV